MANSAIAARAPARAGQTQVKILRIEPIAVSLPMTKPMKMAGVLITAADNVLVRVELEGGHSGWGEAASAHSMTGETVESMMAAIRHMAPSLANMDGADIAAVSRRMDQLMYYNQSAKSAVEMALHDALGKATGKPVYELLGGKRRSRVPVLWLLGTGSVAGDVAEARSKQTAGFVAFKVKVGVGDAQDDAQRTRRVCEALGSGLLISADANQGYSVEQAIGFVKAVEGAGLDFFEQPIAGHDIDGMAKIAAATSIPIGFDEGLHGIEDLIQHHERRAARGCSLKTIKLGGLRGVVRAAELCRQLDMKVNLACKVAESGIAAASLMHLAAAIPSVEWGVSISNQYLADDIVRAPVRVVAGHAEVPEGVGLGVEVDEARVRKYQRQL
jgi:L-alanine-DL-glutamate epimerase-like enolase superfamily enzyme